MRKITGNIRKGFFFRLIIYSFILFILIGQLNLEIIPALSCLYGIGMLDNLITSIGKTIPLIELTLALYSLQLLISPALDYYIFNWSFPTGEMKVPDDLYFSYVFFAVLALHLGILLSGSQKKLRILETKIIEKIYLDRATNLKNGWALIVLGVLSTEILRLPIPSAIAFIVLTVSNLKYVGFFYLYFAKSRYVWASFGVVFIPFFISVIKSVMFIDLIIWAFLLLSIMLRGKKVKHSLISILGIFSFVLVFVLQSVKGDYRKLAWNGKEAGLGFFVELVQQKYQNITHEEFKNIGGFVNVRINQGWIITDVQKNLAEHPENYSKGRWFFKELIGVLLPRFIYPNKPVVADKDKYEQFAGRRLREGVAMTVSVLGDGYGNFGKWGGVAFCLLFGFVCGKLRKSIYNLANSKYAPIICWTPIIFFYIMRPGNDFYMIMNYMVKVGSLAIIFFYMTDVKFFNWTKLLKNA